MKSLFRAFGLGLVAVVAVGMLAGQEPPKPKASSWGQLGLSDDQKQKVYKIQAEYADKLAPLEKQQHELAKKIAALRAEERKEMEKVLTEEQKKRLKELAADKPPVEPKKP